MNDPFAPMGRDWVLKEIEGYLTHPDETAYVSIGVAYQHHQSPAPRRTRVTKKKKAKRGFSRPDREPRRDYGGIGRSLWKGLRYELHGLLCKGGVPREVVNDVVSGDAREVALVVVGVVVSQLSLPLTIAVPVAGLVAKHGLLAFCASDRGQKGEKTTDKLLAERAKRTAVYSVTIRRKK